MEAFTGACGQPANRSGRSGGLLVAISKRRRFLQSAAGHWARARGADINARDNTGSTPLATAIEEKASPVVVECLRRQGATL